MNDVTHNNSNNNKGKLEKEERSTIKASAILRRMSNNLVPSAINTCNRTYAAKMDRQRHTLSHSTPRHPVIHQRKPNIVRILFFRVVFIYILHIYCVYIIHKYAECVALKTAYNKRNSPEFSAYFSNVHYLIFPHKRQSWTKKIESAVKKKTKDRSSSRHSSRRGKKNKQTTKTKKHCVAQRRIIWIP